MDSDEDGVVDTYVFENTEVVKTGRKAQRKLTSGKIDELVEVTPTDRMNGTWKKWVIVGQLHTVLKD